MSKVLIDFHMYIFFIISYQRFIIIFNLVGFKCRTKIQMISSMTVYERI